MIPFAVFRGALVDGYCLGMLQHAEDNLRAFRAQYSEIADAEIPAAYECFRRYVRLAIEIAESRAGLQLTDAIAGGTVSSGQVDPTRTFTNIG
jgi:hypothetical protein